MSTFKEIIPGSIPVPELHQFLLGSINPRPIAFVSTMNTEGKPNLAPFSFFNVFGANPPIVVFSPARRGRDNTTKDTFENIKKTRECTVNIVNYNMVDQMVLASSEYATGVDEFERAGFEKLPAHLVKPFRVGQSPSQMECKVRDIINYGEIAGGGNLIIAEVVKLHINEEVIGADGKIDPFKIDTVGRCGKNWYSRPKTSLFEIAGPKGKDNIGFDGIPETIKNSKILSGNDLGRLGKHPALPNREEIAAFLAQHPEIARMVAEGGEQRLHTTAKNYLKQHDLDSAWKVLMATVAKTSS